MKRIEYFTLELLSGCWNSTEASKWLIGANHILSTVFANYMFNYFDGEKQKTKTQIALLRFRPNLGDAEDSDEVVIVDKWTLSRRQTEQQVVLEFLHTTTIWSDVLHQLRSLALQFLQLIYQRISYESMEVDFHNQPVPRRLKFGIPQSVCSTSKRCHVEPPRHLNAKWSR